MDLMILEHDKKIHIVDYKTGHIEIKDEHELKLVLHEQNIEKQLKAYELAAKSLFPNHEIRSSVLHIPSGHLIGMS